MAKKKKKSSSSSSYKSSSNYNSLSSDEKKLADLYASVSSGSSKYTTKQLKDALKNAKKDSSGYMQQILRESEAQVSLDYASETGDYQSHLDTINENIKEINEDLATNSQYLTLTEQQDLAKQARDYEQQRGNLIQSTAAQGITFSTGAEQQKSYAEATNKGIVEGTTAQYNKQMADLQTQASRGNLQAQQQLKDLSRTHQQNIQQIGLKAETYLGTSKLGKLNLTGYTPLGDISGGFKDASVQDINQRQQSYLDQARMGSLNF